MRHDLAGAEWWWYVTRARHDARSANALFRNVFEPKRISHFAKIVTNWYDHFLLRRPAPIYFHPTFPAPCPSRLEPSPKPLNRMPHRAQPQAPNRMPQAPDRMHHRGLRARPPLVHSPGITCARSALAFGARYRHAPKARASTLRKKKFSPALDRLVFLYYNAVTLDVPRSYAMLIVTHFHATTRATRPAMSFAIDPESASTATPSTRRWARRERSRIADAYGHRRALALGLLILRAQRREIAHAGSPTCGCEPREPIGNAVFCRRCGTCLAVSD